MFCSLDPFTAINGYLFFFLISISVLPIIYRLYILLKTIYIFLCESHTNTKKHTVSFVFVSLPPFLPINIHKHDGCFTSLFKVIRLYRSHLHLHKHKPQWTAPRAETLGVLIPQKATTSYHPRRAVPLVLLFTGTNLLLQTDSLGEFSIISASTG